MPHGPVPVHPVLCDVAAHRRAAVIAAVGQNGGRSWSGPRRSHSTHTDRVGDEELRQVAALLEERNVIDDRIAAHIERPMTSGHLGEWIAAQVFDIALQVSASATAFDGRFRSGPLRDRTVNVKWYLKREGILDMTTSEDLDEYLVMTGPPGPAASSRGGTRPWRIDSVYLFEAHSLKAALDERGLHIGTATSIRASLWAQAEIYPQPVNPRLPLDREQVRRLRLFGA